MVTTLHAILGRVRRSHVALSPTIRHYFVVPTQIPVIPRAVSTVVPPQPPIRSLSSSSSSSSSSTEATTTTATTATTAVHPYWAQKAAAKESRREAYARRQERRERVRQRRVHRNNSNNNNPQRQAFRDFFLAKKIHEEYLNRKARQAGLDWDLRVAVVLERTNVVLPDPPDWETDFVQLQEHLARYGKDYPRELQLGQEEDDDDENLPMTAEEVLAAYLPKGFVPAPRETEADKNGNVRTTNRKLQDYLYLAVQTDDDQSPWQLPAVALDDDETLLTAAQRALAQALGDNNSNNNNNNSDNNSSGSSSADDELQYWCPSNSPVAVDMVAFTEDERAARGRYGTKTFFMRLQHEEGDVQQWAAHDFAWLDRTEFVARIRQEQGDYVSQFYQYML